MSGLNITAYKSEPDEYQMYYGKASLKEGYYIANFDERFFHCILAGVKRYLSMPELIHPDDVDTFMEAVEKLEEGPQKIILRIQCYNDKYRYFYAVILYNGKVLDGFKSMDIEICEVMTIKDRYRQYMGLVEKYREFLTLYDGLYMEYHCKKDEFQLYCYENRQSNKLYKNSLEATNERVMADDSLTLMQKAEFQALYEALKSGKDHIKQEVDAAVFIPGSMIRYEISISTFFWEGERERSIGLVKVISKEKVKKSYYLTENAFDPGTGVLNKRAINEYAIEKIQNKTEGLYLAVMDIDDFKRINDTFGHMFGDEVLSKVAEILKSVIGVRGVVGRFGGDEFMVVYEGIDSETTLRRILSTIGKNVEWAFNDVEGLSVTFSTGVSKFPEDGTTYEELFQKADLSVYIGKQKGKNRYIIYDVLKHGMVQKEDDTRIKIGLRATISEDKKHEVASDLVLKLHTEGESALLYVMEQMQSYFDIDGIAIYAGEDMKRICSVGKYFNPIEKIPGVLSDAYQSFFDEQGFCELDRINPLQKKAPDVYEQYAKQENGKVVQCAAMRDGKPVALVSYDYFNRFPKAGVTDSGLMKVVGRMMAEVLAGK